MRVGDYQHVCSPTWDQIEDKFPKIIRSQKVGANVLRGRFLGSVVSQLRCHGMRFCAFKCVLPELLYKTWVRLHTVFSKQQQKQQIKRSTEQPSFSCPPYSLGYCTHCGWK